MDGACGRDCGPLDVRLLRKEGEKGRKMNENLHGGDIYNKKITLDFSVNVNPLGMPPRVQQVLRDSIEYWDRYPDPECRALTRKLGEYHGVGAERIVCGNGAADLIYRLVSAVRPGRALLPAPTFSEYERALLSVHSQVRYVYLKEEQNYQIDVQELSGLMETGDMLFLCNPNNPTGLAVKKGQIELLAGVCREKKGFLVLDECFCEFLDQPEEYTFMEKIREHPRVMILRAFTKSYAMAGLRLGYAVCGDIRMAQKLRLTGQPWSVSVPAQEAGAAAVEEKDYLEKTRALIRTEREWMRQRLTELRFQVFPSQVNYLLFKDKEEGRHGNLWEHLQRQEILIRDCSNFGGLEAAKSSPFCRYYRTGIRTRKENEILITGIRRILA